VALVPLVLRAATLDWSRPYIMGVVNTTPDSFSDGGQFLATDAAVAHARALVADGADIVDIGGESTRPHGAEPVSAAEEIDRVIPVIEALVGNIGVPISIDTTKSEVAGAAVAAGADIVNDISGGGFDPRITAVTAAAGAAYVCSHARGRSIAEVHAGEGASPGYDEVVAELGARLSRLPPTLRTRTIVDPGLGFGKQPAQNIDLSRRAGELSAALDRPVLLGPSRKRFVAAVAPSTRTAPADPWLARDAATVGAVLAGVGCGAHIVRVHNVAMVKSALTVYRAIILSGDSWAPS
jgi:dihydropteroate synthase